MIIIIIFMTIGSIIPIVIALIAKKDGVSMSIFLMIPLSGTSVMASFFL